MSNTVVYFFLIPWIVVTYLEAFKYCRSLSLLRLRAWLILGASVSLFTHYVVFGPETSWVSYVTMFIYGGLATANWTQYIRQKVMTPSLYGLVPSEAEIKDQMEETSLVAMRESLGLPPKWETLDGDSL